MLSPAANPNPIEERSPDRAFFDGLNGELS